MSIDSYDPKFIDNNPWQTRSREPDQAYIEELAEDIKKNGLLQVPIGRIINHNGAGKVQLAFGHNRLRAFLHLKRPLMPVDVRVLNDEQMAAFAWSENEKRRDVTAVERALAIQKRIKDFGWTNRQAAEALGVDHSTISNLLRLLKLPEEIRQANLEGKISERQADALLPLFDLPSCIDPSFGYWFYGLTGHVYLSVKTIPEEAIKNDWSSDVIRKMVSDYFERFGEELTDAEFKLDQLIPEENGVYCGLCKTCDKRVPSRNLCFDKGCFEAKVAYVRRQYLIKASTSSGYDLVDETKGGHTSKIPSGSWEQKKRERILATKCPNLRLQYTLEKVKDIPSFPHAWIVCDKRNNSCTCIKGLDVMKQEMSQHPSRPLSEVMYENFEDTIDVEEPEEEIVEDEDDELEEEEGTVSQPAAIESRSVTSAELEEAARQQRKAKIELTKKTEEIQAKLEKHMLEEVRLLSPGAFYVVLHRYGWPSERDLDLEKIFNYMAKEAAKVITNYRSAENVDGFVRLINDQLERLKLRPFSLEETVPQPVKVAQDEPAFPEF